MSVSFSCFLYQNLATLRPSHSITKNQKSGFCIFFDFSCHSRSKIDEIQKSGFWFLLFLFFVGKIYKNLATFLEIFFNKNQKPKTKNGFSTNGHFSRQTRQASRHESVYIFWKHKKHTTEKNLQKPKTRKIRKRDRSSKYVTVAFYFFVFLEFCTKNLLPNLNLKIESFCVTVWIFNLSFSVENWN